MWISILSTIIVLICILTLIAKGHTKRSLKDKNSFDSFVAKNNLTIEQQKELCERFGLDHQIGHRSYDSVEDWENELTTIWLGEAEDIEFTYRKYDERERRTISPREFGYDGNKKPYIRGICRVSNEQRTFKTARIETKIKVGSKRFELTDWLGSKLGVDTYKLVQNLKVKL